LQRAHLTISSLSNCFSSAFRPKQQTRQTPKKANWLMPATDMSLIFALISAKVLFNSISDSCAGLHRDCLYAMMFEQARSAWTKLCRQNNIYSMIC
jgi:hypothetical protein